LGVDVLTWGWNEEMGLPTTQNLYQNSASLQIQTNSAMELAEDKQSNSYGATKKMALEISG
jgi:hypothetical protein